MTEPHMPNLVETLQNALQRAADNFARCQEENARLAKRVAELETDVERIDQGQGQV